MYLQLQFKWHRHIKDKFKNLRKRKDRDHPTVAAKRLKFGSSTPTSKHQQSVTRSKNVWGVANFLPPRDAGEDDTSISMHKTWLKMQSRLDESHRDSHGVDYRMEKTFADRRSAIVTNSAGVATIKDDYPILFSEEQVCNKHLLVYTF